MSYKLNKENNSLESGLSKDANIVQENAIIIVINIYFVQLNWLCASITFWPINPIPTSLPIPPVTAPSFSCAKLLK